jgi:hypothetical protein
LPKYPRKVILDIFSDFSASTYNGKKEICTGKFDKSCTSADTLYVAILRLEPNVNGPANIFLEKKSTGHINNTDRTID